MLMPMVNIRKVGVAVRLWRVLMRVAVWFSAIPVGLMVVLVVSIVAVPVRMVERAVLVVVRVVFAQVQPDPGGH